VQITNSGATSASGVGFGALEQEVWREIPGWEGVYSISNMGRVKSHERTCQGRYVRRVRERILTNHVNGKNGHGNPAQSVTVKLSNAEVGGSTCVPVGRLMLLVFVGQPNNENAVAHYKDGNPLNARLDNLMWSTFSAIGKERGYSPPRRTKRK